MGLLGAKKAAARPAPPYQDGFHRLVNLVVLGLALHAHGKCQVFLSFLPILHRGVHQCYVVEYLPEGWEQGNELLEESDLCQDVSKGEDSRVVAVHQVACFFTRHKKLSAISLDILSW